MSILIQGISLPPKDANPITLMIFHDGSIWHYDDETDFKAIELPPHGRLGDLDALLTQYGRNILTRDIFMRGKIETVVSAEDIENATTIIPADPDGGADG